MKKRIALLDLTRDVCPHITAMWTALSGVCKWWLYVYDSSMCGYTYACCVCILCVYPSLSADFNSYAYVIEYLCRGAILQEWCYLYHKPLPYMDPKGHGIVFKCCLCQFCGYLYIRSH